MDIGTFVPTTATDLPTDEEMVAVLRAQMACIAAADGDATGLVQARAERDRLYNALPERQRRRFRIVCFAIGRRPV